MRVNSHLELASIVCRHYYLKSVNITNIIGNQFEGKHGFVMLHCIVIPIQSSVDAAPRCHEDVGFQGIWWLNMWKMVEHSKVKDGIQVSIRYGSLTVCLISRKFWRIQRVKERGKD